MFRSDRLFIVIGVFLAIIVFVGFYFYSGRLAAQQQAAAAEQEVQVVVAAADIPAHSLIKTEMLKMESVDIRSVGADDLIDAGQAVGRSNTVALMAGQRVLAGQLGDPDFSLAVPKGKRAMAVAVDDLSGVAGLLRPGDFVDVIASVKEPFEGKRTAPEGQQVIELPTTKTIIQDIEVIKVSAIASPLNQQSQATAEGTQQPATGQQQAIAGNMVVLAVTDQEAELVKFTRENGEIHLVLRAKDDHDKQDTLGTTHKLLVEKFGVPVP